MAALQILLYHCWMPVFGYGTVLGSAERFLVAATYSGVDVFFFISAYSLVSRPVEDYRQFIVNRAVKLLPLFLIALIFGQFLWFIPSILTVYLVLPPIYKLCRKRPMASLVLLLTGWAGMVYLVLGVIRPAQDFGIFLFRIPSIILGAYAVKYGGRLSRSRKLILGILMLAAGLLLIYRFGYTRKLDVPFEGAFYLTGIPVMLGTVILTDIIASNRSMPVIERFGKMTLELYFTQMVFGTFLVGLFYKLTGSRPATNLAVMAVIFAAAFTMRLINDEIMKRLERVQNKKT